MKVFNRIMLGISICTCTIMYFCPNVSEVFKTLSEQEVIPLEGVLAFEASILALLIPIAFFLLDSSNNSDKGITKLDMRVVLEKVIEAKRLAIWIIVISMIGIFWNVFPLWISALVLIAGYMNVFSLIKKSYKWLTSRTVVVNEFEQVSETFQDKLRMEYINSLQKTDELIEVYGLIFKHGGWSYFNGDKLIQSYLVSLARMDAKTKSEAIDLLLNSIDGKYSDSTFQFTRMSKFGEFINVLVLDMNYFLDDDKISNVDAQFDKSQRIRQIESIMKYSLQAENTGIGDLKAFNFNSEFWGNVAKLELENRNQMKMFLDIFLCGYFDNYTKRERYSKTPAAFRSEWNITFKNIYENDVSSIIYTEWLNRIFDDKYLNDEKKSISEKTQEITEWLMPDVEYGQLGWNYHVLYHIEQYLWKVDTFLNDDSKKRYWQSVLLRKSKFSFSKNYDLLVNVQTFWNKIDMSYKEEQQQFENMLSRETAQEQAGIEDADKLAFTRLHTKYVLNEHPNAFEQIKKILSNIKFEEEFEFKPSSNMQAIIVHSEQNDVEVNKELKKSSGASELFYQNKMLFLQSLERLESVYKDLNSVQTEN